MGIFRRDPVEVTYPVPRQQQSRFYEKTDHRTDEQKQADQDDLNKRGLPLQPGQFNR